MQFTDAWLRALEKNFADGNKMKIEHVAVDPTNIFWNAVEDQTCEEHGVKTLAEIQKAIDVNGWALAYPKFRSFLTRLQKLPCSYHLITHTKRAYVDDRPAGRSPDLAGRLSREVPGKVDAIGFVCAEFKDGSTVVSVDFMPSPLIESGSRIKNWTGKRIVLPPDKGWEALVKAANGEEVETIDYPAEMTALDQMHYAGKLGKDKYVQKKANIQQSLLERDQNRKEEKNAEQSKGGQGGLQESSRLHGGGEATETDSVARSGQ